MRRVKRGPGRPPGRTSDVTRAKILRAARVTFALKGFGVATNRDIAEHAGVTAAAIYQYFDSKATLFVTAAREAVAEVAAHMRAPAASDAGAAAIMSGIVMSLIALHEQDPSLAAFLSALPGELRRHPEIARAFNPQRTDLTAIMSGVVERAVASGEIEAKDAGRVAEMFIACMMGLSQYAALGGRGRPIGSAFAELLEGRLFARVPVTAAAPARRARSSGLALKRATRRRV